VPAEAESLVVADRYELETVVGRGGYGVVYRALDRHKNEPVAVKVLSPGAAADPSVVERMVREQQAMLALAGTRAVTAVDLCRLPSGALCLVMEWLEGEDLEHHLCRLEAANQRMAPERLLEIVGAIADTLNKAHEIGIVHRDIKPANIFLMSNDPRGVRLLDFGLSRMKSAATLTAVGTVMGSPSYIAPESWRGNSKLVDQRVDVYSLGVIAFRALGGQNPFSGRSLIEQLKLVTSAPRPSLRALRPELPPEIDTWVAQALAIDPDQRFRTVRALHTALGEALGLSLPSEPQPVATSVSRAPNQLQSAFESALRKTKELFRRFAGLGEASHEAGSVPSEPSRLPEPGPAQKSFIAEWLAGTDLQRPAGEEASEKDVVNWLGGGSEPAAHALPPASIGSPRVPAPPSAKKRALGAPPKRSEQKKAAHRLPTRRPWLSEQPPVPSAEPADAPKAGAKRSRRRRRRG